MVQMNKEWRRKYNQDAHWWVGWENCQGIWRAHTLSRKRMIITRLPKHQADAMEFQGRSDKWERIQANGRKINKFREQNAFSMFESSARVSKTFISSNKTRAPTRVIECIKANIGKGLFLRQPTELRIVAYADSDYASNFILKCKQQ